MSIPQPSLLIVAARVSRPFAPSSRFVSPDTMASSSAASAASAAASAASAASAELARERAAMAAADAQSFIAQRHFVGSVQVPQAGPIMTWQALYELRHDDLMLAHQAMRGVRRHLQAGRPRWALAMLSEEIGSSDEEEAEEEAEEEEPQQDELVLPPAFQAFSGVARRLD